ncbi:MAG: hypothetical protein K2L21_04125 [Muribaculaceae bacterium]|nr:hypothetical protein [Muribaculaceae bacterium]
MAAFTDSISGLPSCESYNSCLERLRAGNPDDGMLYRTAYYHAVNADSVVSYASFLDSMLAANPGTLHRQYIMSYRALCAYLCKEPSYQSLLNAAAALPPDTDRTQEMVCTHMIARLLSESDAAAAYDMQQRALHAMRHGGRWSSAEVLAQAADLCCEMGRYSQAMDFLNEAHDTLDNNNSDARDIVYVLGNKANLYSSVEMFDSALVANRRALEVARGNDFLLTDLLTFRAFIFNGKGCADSAFAYLDSAERIVDTFTSPYVDVFRRYIRARRAVLTVKAGTRNDSLQAAIYDLEAYIPESGGAWEEKLALGYARWLTGDASGVVIMEEARDSMSANLEPALLLSADRRLIDVYTRAGRLADAAELYKETFALIDSIDMRHARYQSIASDLQYRVKTHQQENNRLRQEISQERGRVLWLTIACVLGVALLLWAGLYLVLSHRLHLRRRAIDSHQITSLIENQKALNRRIEQLQTATEADKNWSELIPSSMSADDIARFRHSFMALYPGFIERLKARCPGLTTGDENLCMLIRIGQTTDDIALALGISKASANSARYRIRKKMALAKDESLDELIYSL